MKKLLIIAFSLFVTSVFAQSINPKQYAVIDPKIFSGVPSLSYETMVFTPSGDYLFMILASGKIEGKLVVYSLKLKSEVKTFKVGKTGMEFFDGLIVCNPNNTNQLAVVLNQNEIMVINNWQSAPTDVLTQKPSEHSKLIKANLRWGRQMSFSKDGKSLFIIENDAKILKTADLETGKVVVNKMPNGKVPYVSVGFESTFIGNDELIVFKESKKPENRVIEIFDITANQIVRKYELQKLFGKLESEVPTNNSLGNLHIVSFSHEGVTLNLRTGEVNHILKKIKTSIASSGVFQLHQVSSVGYALGYLFYEEKNNYNNSVTRTTKKGLFFFNADGKMVEVSFPAVNSKIPVTPLNNIQISANGKYIIFRHEDRDDYRNVRLVIATLY